jgi:hypothetical protein
MPKLLCVAVPEPGTRAFIAHASAKLKKAQKREEKRSAKKSKSAERERKRREFTLFCLCRAPHSKPGSKARHGQLGKGGGAWVGLRYVYMNACIYVYMYLCMYVCMYVCVYVYMFICMHVCMCVRMYVCEFIYTDTWTKGNRDRERKPVARKY